MWLLIWWLNFNYKISRAKKLETFFSHHNVQWTEEKHIAVSRIAFEIKNTIDKLKVLKKIKTT